MNLIERIKEMQKLEAKATHGECIAIEDDDRSGDFLIIRSKEHWAWKDGSNSIDAKYIASLRNNMPELLLVMGEIRTGDSMMLNQCATYLELHVIDQDKPEKHNHWIEILSMLRRYQAMAHRMEANK